MQTSRISDQSNTSRLASLVLTGCYKQLYEMHISTIVCLCFFALVLVFGGTNAAGECPAPTKVYSCSPKCVQNYDCSHGKLCCENSCHTKSCVEKAAYGSGGSSDRNNQQSGGAGVYCNNVKCSPFEVCKMDPSSKRLKCSRA